MVLVDTSVWVEHFRKGYVGLDVLLNNNQVVCHSFVIGELACGNLKNRQQILSLLHVLPGAFHAEDKEVMHFIEIHRLMGKGLGYIDMHLLVSATLTQIPLWTLDKRLGKVASLLKAAY